MKTPRVLIITTVIELIGIRMAAIKGVKFPLIAKDNPILL